jgi:hypothetical protein
MGPRRGGLGEVFAVMACVNRRKILMAVEVSMMVLVWLRDHYVNGDFCKHQQVMTNFILCAASWATKYQFAPEYEYGPGRTSRA